MEAARQRNRRTSGPAFVAIAIMLGLPGTATALELGETRLHLGETTEDADTEGVGIASMIEPTGAAPAWLTWLGEDVHYELGLSAWRDAARDEDDVFTVHFGPTWQYDPQVIDPVFIEIGTAPTLVSEDELAESDIGGNFQFTSHVTVGTRFGRGDRWEAGVRVQHISNAGIEDENPGLNFVMFEVGYRFAGL